MPSMNCCSAVTRPRMLGWQSSAWYMGTTIVVKPTLFQSARLLLYVVATWECLPNTGQGSSRIQVVDVTRTGLQGTAQTEDDSPDEDSQLAAKSIARRAGEERAYEGSAREDGHDSAAVIQTSVGGVGRGPRRVLTSLWSHLQSAA